MPNTRFRLPVGRYSTFGHISQAIAVDVPIMMKTMASRRATLGCAQRLIATTEFTNRSADQRIGAIIRSVKERCAAGLGGAAELLPASERPVLAPLLLMSPSPFPSTTARCGV